MIWFLPVIVIGGLFWSVLGYIVFLMMIFFLTLSYFKGRLWCSSLCPRGSFLDIVLSKYSLKKKIPGLVISPAFKWTVFVLFMTFFIFQLATAEKTVYAIGFVFVKMCLITTIISVVLGLAVHQRMWCMFCPMGTLQSAIASLGKKGRASERV
jgi:polyferredoxin